MIILGIDPGTATTGFGLIRKELTGVEVIEWGLIETKKDKAPAERLAEIYEKLLSLLDKHKPDVVVMEMVFFASNAKTVIRVGQAQGVILLSAASSNIRVIEYAPGTIKKVISGDGRANKIAMQKAVRKIFGAKVRSEAHKRTHFDNAADALAVAMCHAIVDKAPDGIIPEKNPKFRKTKITTAPIPEISFAKVSK